MGLEERPREHRSAAPNDLVPEWLEVPPSGDDPVRERRRQAHDLVAGVRGDRATLEDLRAGFLRRLHRASDDFGATEGLRVTEAALALAARPPGRSVSG